MKSEHAIPNSSGAPQASTTLPSPASSASPASSPSASSASSSASSSPTSRSPSSSPSPSPPERAGLWNKALGGEADPEQSFLANGDGSHRAVLLSAEAFGLTGQEVDPPGLPGAEGLTGLPRLIQPDAHERP